MSGDGVVTNKAGVSEAANITDSEWIRRQVTKAVKRPFIYKQVAPYIDMRSATSRRYTHPLLANLSAAAAITEGDEIDSVAPSISELSVDVTLVGKNVFLSKQAEGAQIWSAQMYIDQVVDAVQLKIDNDLLGLASSMTSPLGNNSQLCTWSFLMTVFTRARNKFKSAQNLKMVLHPDAVGDLLDDSTGSNAGLHGSVFGPAAVAAITQQGVTNQGAAGAFMGIPIFISEGVPNGDTSGRTNFLCVTDETGPGLVLAVKKDIQVEAVYEALRQGTHYVATADYGVGIVDQARCLGFITKGR